MIPLPPFSFEQRQQSTQTNHRKFKEVNQINLSSFAFLNIPALILWQY